MLLPSDDSASLVAPIGQRPLTHGAGQFDWIGDFAQGNRSELTQPMFYRSESDPDMARLRIRVNHSNGIAEYRTYNIDYEELDSDNRVRAWILSAYAGPQKLRYRMRVVNN